MKNFYIVKDERDLLSGNIIPKKVLNYLPVRSFGFGPIIQPMPITKSQSVVIQPNPTTSIIGFPQFNSPVSVTRSISPLFNTVSQTSECGQSIMSPCEQQFSATSPTSSIFATRPQPPSQANLATYKNVTMGPPIIKLGPMIQQGTNGIIKIIVSDNIYTIDVPIKYMRPVVNDIYLNSQTNLNPFDPKVTFRIITPTIDSSLNTTPQRLIQTLNSINNKYTGLTYLHNDGTKQQLATLLALLLAYYKSKNINL